jgi:hypothetical protein
MKLNMKNTVKPMISISSFVNLYAGYTVKHSLVVAPIFFIVLMFSACGSDATKEEVAETEIAQGADSIHVAFAGGGWRAHTGHSGWTMSLLNNGKKQRTLDEAFTNVRSMSSNSGGSWFSTMLMYSEDFNQAIEAKNAFETWDSSGWLGQQKNIFDDVYCEHSNWLPYFRCILDHLGENGEEAGHWKAVIEKLVFRDYSIDTTITLADNHLDWAVDKPLLLAASLLTKEVVMNDNAEDSGINYYQACIAPSNPQWDNEYGGASCAGGESPYVSPVIFSSIPASFRSTVKVPPFFPQIHSGSSPANFRIGYYDKSATFPFEIDTFLQNPVRSDQLPVMVAASASSAALGFTASASILYQNDIGLQEQWNLAYEAEDEALSFELRDSTVKYIDASALSNYEMKDRQVVRIADGGPVDNSGVAQIIKYLQMNGEADGFNIVAFDNVEQPFYPFERIKANPVGGDIAYLFGENLDDDGDTGFCTDFGFLEFCIDVPKLQVFEAISLDTTQITWHIRHNDNPKKQLVYTKYKVTTTDNNTFGITKGSHGTLHAFTCIWEGAGTGPFTDPKSNFKAYAEMLNFIKDGLRANEGEGLHHLERAMGLIN